MKYTTLLKGKLQEICTERGLSTEGTKDVLIERLEENDKLRAELEDEPVEEQKEDQKGDQKEDQKEEPDAAAEPAPAVEEPVEAQPDVPAAPAAAAPVVEEKPAISAEEAMEIEKKSQLDDLTKRIARAHRFGDEESAKSLEAQKTRIEKFGLAPKSEPKAKSSNFNGVSKPFNRRKTNKYHKNNRTH